MSRDSESQPERPRTAPKRRRRTGVEPAEYAGHSKAELVEQLGNEFRINQNRSQAFDDLAGRVLGINATDLRCLDIVHRLGGTTAGTLAREAGLTTGGVTAVVDRLERDGYARRVRDSEDRRRVLIEVTPDFHERAWGIWEPMARAWQSQARRLTREQIEFLLGFLREADEILDEQIERLRALREQRDEAADE